MSILQWFMQLMLKWQPKLQEIIKSNKTNSQKHLFYFSGRNKVKQK